MFLVVDEDMIYLVFISSKPFDYGSFAYDKILY